MKNGNTSEEVLKEAKAALEDAFGPKSSQVNVSVSKDNTTMNLSEREVLLMQATIDEQNKLNKEKIPNISYHDIIKEALDDTKTREDAKKRKEAVEDAKNTLYTAFNKKFEDMFHEQVSANDIDDIIKELEEESTGVKVECSGKYEPGTGKIKDDGFNTGYEPVAEKKKTIAETRDLIKNFKEKTANYPMHISYDGSTGTLVFIGFKIG